MGRRFARQVSSRGYRCTCILTRSISRAWECEENVKITHENQIQTSREKLLGASIVERLKNKYSANQQELRSFVKDMVGFAGNYLSFDEKERNKREQGISTGPTCISSFTAFLPKAPEHAEFMELLKKTLKESRSADQGEVHIIETDSKQNEITLVNVTNLFPNRFIRQVQNLKEKYKRRISGPDQEKIKMELHAEGDGSKHPKLYIEVDEHDGIMYFLMAKAMGLVIERENQTTGARVLSIITKDEDGFDNEPVDFGSSISEVPDNLDVTMTNLIKNEVEYVLKHDGYKHTDN